MNAAVISAELRTGASGSLRRRRTLVGLSLAASGAMTVISAFQTGLLKHLPEPPLPRLDADRVDSSPEAYPLGVPDALLGLGSYAATAALAAAGGEQRSPLLSFALAGKVALDTAVAAKLTVDQWTKHRAFCAWCLLASGATFASVPLAAIEARAALHRLRTS
jgi:uncharacterized membrane protein